ncbi:MAG: alpha/beta hydrolase [Oceanicaulis sp.]
MADARETPEPIRETIPLSDGEIALLRWPAPGKPLLVFAHANGFCASAAKRMLTDLSDTFEIVAPDLRGHGRSRLPANPPAHRSWDVYAEDLKALYETLGRTPHLLAGHSMGASSTLLAASRMPSPPPLALIEPVVLPAPVALSARTPLWALVKRSMAISKTARKRTNAWTDREAVLERYRAKPNFARWAPGVLEDYLEDGLRDAGGGVALACDPQWEAANYEAQAHDLLAAARRVRAPVKVFKAAHGSTVLNPSGLARRGVQVEAVSDVGHLAVMEQPERAAAWIRQVWEDSA